jgi:predicted peptidase
MINRREFCSAFAGALFMTGSLLVESSPVTFLVRTYKNVRGERMPYRLFVPQGYDKRKRYPLVLWLHGGAGRGDDNLKQITGGNTSGSHVWTKPENQSKYPCMVVAPQCPGGEQWTSYVSVKSSGQMRLVLEIMTDVQKEFSVDAARLYVTGQSMGGFGTWAMIAEHPLMFAAAIPVCGGGNESQASILVNTPVWAFHGERDEAVSVERSRRMIAAIRKAGGAPKYTEYKGAGHVIWDEVFNEPDLLPWLFAQKRA